MSRRSWNKPERSTTGMGMIVVASKTLGIAPWPVLGFASPFLPRLMQVPMLIAVTVIIEPGEDDDPTLCVSHSQPFEIGERMISSGESMEDDKTDQASMLGSDNGTESGHEITSHGIAGSLPGLAGTHRTVRKQFANSRKKKTVAKKRTVTKRKCQTRETVSDTRPAREMISHSCSFDSSWITVLKAGQCLQNARSNQGPRLINQISCAFLSLHRYKGVDGGISIRSYRSVRRGPIAMVSIIEPHLTTACSLLGTRRSSLRIRHQ